MIVDSHTHWDAWQSSTAKPDPADWLDVLDRHGVTHAVVFPTQGLFDAGGIAQDNDAVAAACAASGGRMLACCSVNIWNAKQAIEELRRCLTVHKIGGLKIHPWLQGSSPSWAQMDQVCDVAAEFDVPIIFHDGTPCFSLPSQMALLARRHPKATIVLGHCGLLEHWREAVAALNATDNLWGCLCGPHWAGLRELTRRSDPDRTVWGSDVGFGESDPIGYRLNVVRTLGLADDRLERIFAHNPCRLFKLDPS